MKFLIVYIVVAGGERTERYAQRFTSSFRTFPPGGDYELCVVENGGPATSLISRHFEGIIDLTIPRPNNGWDIGAYIEMANCAGTSDFDMMLCLGQSCYFHRAGWLARLDQVCNTHGPGLYGFFASNLIRRHLNTTAFCVTPKILRGWNQKVETKEQRYVFEHGEQPFWKQVEKLGFPVRLVMWNHDLAPWQWRTTENEFWRGNQSQCLLWCSHTDRYQNAVQATRTRWEHNADRGITK